MCQELEVAVAFNTHIYKLIHVYIYMYNRVSVFDMSVFQWGSCIMKRFVYHALSRIKSVAFERITE